MDAVVAKTKHTTDPVKQEEEHIHAPGAWTKT
jgi:hypothetical protein